MSWFGKDKNKHPHAPAVKPAATAGKEAIKVLSGGLSLVARPHQSEKAVRLEKANQFTLAMLPGANKSELKKQLEKIYGVHVVQITSVRLPGKKIRTRNSMGQRSVRRFFRIRLKPGEILDVNKVKN